MVTKSMRVSFNLYVFLLLSTISCGVFAGADPDELTLEEEMQQQKVVKEVVVKKETVKNDEKLEVQECDLSVQNHKGERKTFKFSLCELKPYETKKIYLSFIWAPKIIGRKILMIHLFKN